MTSVSAVLISLLLNKGPSDGAEVSTVRLDIPAKSDCASGNEIIAGVSARSSRIRFADDAAYTARVIFTMPRQGGVIAELVVAATGANPEPRRVTARSCAEAADAVALVIAVTLDPSSARSPSAEPSPANRMAAEQNVWPPGAPDMSGRPSPPSSLPSSRPTEPVARLAERPPMPSKPVPTVVESPAGPVDATSAVSRTLVLYAVGQSLFGPAPSAMPGLSLYALAGLNRQSVWSPALGLGIAHAWRNDLREPGGTASFAVDSANVDLCPMTVRASVLATYPCVSALIGWTSSSGSDTDAPASSTRPFVSVGGSIVLSVALGNRVFLAGRLGTGVTPIRDSYYFGTTSFHRAALFTTWASLGIGVALP